MEALILRSPLTYWLAS